MVVISIIGDSNKCPWEYTKDDSPRTWHQTNKKVNQVQQNPQRLLKVSEGWNLNDSAP